MKVILFILVLVLLLFWKTQEGFEDDQSKSLLTLDTKSNAMDINKKRVDDLDALVTKQSEQLADIGTIVATLKAQKLAEKPDITVT